LGEFRRRRVWEVIRPLRQFRLAFLPPAVFLVSVRRRARRLLFQNRPSFSAAPYGRFFRAKNTAWPGGLLICRQFQFSRFLASE
jgi:hypothetical protein